ETIGQLTSKLALPRVEVLSLEGVHGLLVAAVMLSVADEIPNQPTAQTGHPRARCTHLYRFKSRPLPDASPPAVLVGIGSRVAQVDRVESCHRVRLQAAHGALVLRRK